MNPTVMLSQVAAEHRRDLMATAERSRLVSRRPSATDHSRTWAWATSFVSRLGRTARAGVECVPAQAVAKRHEPDTCRPWSIRSA